MDKGSEKKQYKLSSSQKVIGRRMMLSKKTQPCFYIGIDADITALNKFRRQASKKLNARLTTNDFFFKAISESILRYPLFAAKIKDNMLQISENINVGFAVSAGDEKLFVPVIKQTDQMTIERIAACSADLTTRAKSGKLTPADMEGASVALTSLGMFGIDEFIAILPPDMAGIIAIGKPKDTPLAVEGDLVVRKIISLTLAADSRVVAPNYAARFLKTIAEYIQNPRTLLQTDC